MDFRCSRRKVDLKGDCWVRGFAEENVGWLILSYLEISYSLFLSDGLFLVSNEACSTPFL